MVRLHQTITKMAPLFFMLLGRYLGLKHSPTCSRTVMVSGKIEGCVSVEFVTGSSRLRLSLKSIVLNVEEPI